MLLTIVSKILERHIFNILRDFMHNQCPLSPNQWGFCSGKSTSTALAYITHCWNAKLHTGVDICAVFFDLRKAFDRALLQKLSKLDLPPLLFQWLQDYLTGRFKQVAIGEAISRLLPVLLGVPQGSTLGPLLFIFFIDDICDLPLSKDSTLALYADDICYSRPICSSEDFAIVQREIDLIGNWSSSNHLKFI